MEASPLLVAGVIGLVFIVILWKFLTKNSSQRGLKLPPGPKGWPIVGNLSVIFDQRNHKVLDHSYTKCSRKYGDIYKLSFGSSFIYVISKPELQREAFKHPNLQERFPAVAYERVFGKQGQGIAFAIGEEWRVVRRFALDVFRELGVGRGVFESKITSEVKRLTAAFDKKLDGPVTDIPTFFYMAISNITCGITFGQQFEYEDDKFKTITVIMSDFSKCVGAGGMLLSSRLLSSFPFGMSKLLFHTLTEFKNFLKEIIDEQMKTIDAIETKDNFTVAFLKKIKTENADVVFNVENLFTCALELFFAGTETGTATLSWAILFLAAFPDYQKKCQEEMDRVCDYDSNKMPSYADKKTHNYLQAFIQEVQRLGNIVPLAIPHVAGCDVKLFGYDVPKGTAITLDMGSVTMDEKIFPNPSEFKPERFLIDGKFQPNKDFLPFSIGARVCLGEQLARMELHIFLMHLTRLYTFSVPDGVTVPDLLMGTHGAVRFPLPFTVNIARRKL